MKKMKNFVKATVMTLLLVMGMYGFVMPVTSVYAAPVVSAPRSNQVTYLSGELKANQSMSKSFTTNAPLPVKVVFTSCPLIGNQAAPVTFYIDGVKVGTTDGQNAKTLIWSLTAGSHTLKVVNSSVAAAFSIDIVTLY